MYAWNAAMRSVTLFWLPVPVSAITFPFLKPAFFMPSTRFIAANRPERLGSCRFATAMNSCPASATAEPTATTGIFCAWARASDGTIAVESATNTTIAAGFWVTACENCCAWVAGSNLL